MFRLAIIFEMADFATDFSVTLVIQSAEAERKMARLNETCKFLVKI